mmetsp:Transcript_21096/g.29795  ORF Transcript_21096/g.29795 Transcript_21096/m.29795 type:complete len:223 (+) Transcript_21096:94-762(+)
MSFLRYNDFWRIQSHNFPHPISRQAHRTFFVLTNIIESFLKFGNSRKKIPALLGIIHRLHRKYTSLDSCFISHIFLLHLTLEEIFCKRCLGKVGIIRILVRIITHGLIVHIICGSSVKENFSLFIEKRYPSSAGIIGDSTRKDPTTDTVGVGSLTFITEPIAICRLIHLEAVLTRIIGIGTSTVPCTTLLVLLEEGESSLETDPIWLVGVGVTHIFVLNGRN